MTEQLDDVLRLAKRLGISEKSVRRLVGANAIPFYRVGGQLRFDAQEVLDSLRAGVSNAAPAP